LPRVAFILCTEPAIERQSLRLCRSIRRWAGAFSQSPIYSFGPRELGISADAAEEFRKLEVQHVEKRLNQVPEYALANKPFAACFAEASIEADYLVWLDSDIVILNEPSALCYAGEAPMAAKPVTEANIGVPNLDGDGPNERFWRRARWICDATEIRYVCTSVDQLRIVEYYNSGVVSTRRGSGLFGRWASKFIQAGLERTFPSNPYFFEQAMLSATAAAWSAPTVQLAEAYNYPARNHDRLPPERRLSSLDQIVAIHCPGAWDEQSERADWLAANSD
jgi:hypothetical protein